MPDDPRVDELLEELLESRRTPEEVCRPYPELLPLVQAGWRRLRALESEVGALFPESTAAGGAKPAFVGAGELPQIRGYDVREVLGRGGMGVVYRARHQRLNREVAIKMLLAGVYARPEESERFLREAEAVAGLRQQNIVQVHDVGDLEGRPYFTMELVEGGSLAQKLAGTPLPADECVPLMISIAEAVEAAHARGIIHRDLKPGNILLTGEGVPKITDFGLARYSQGREGLTLSGAAVGTPSYMSPEQARGERDSIGPQTDVYALGAILYELLTGRPPFRAESEAATIQQVLGDDPAPPTRLNPRVPRDLETICLTCLAKVPLKRYPSAAALAAELGRFSRGESIVARPAALPERAGKWLRRHPGRAALLAAGLILVALLIGGVAWVALENAHVRDAVEADLKEAAGLRDRALWIDARAVLRRSAAQLGWSASGELRQQIAQARRDLDLANLLDNIRLQRLTRGDLRFYREQARLKYQEAFRSAGLGSPADRPEDVAGAIHRSAVRNALVAALDDWLICTADLEQRTWLLAVARRTLPDPGDWQNRILDPANWDRRETLGELAESVPATVRVSLLQALGERLRSAGIDAGPLLRRVQKEHPGDFWANLVLGNALLQRAPHEANGYYRAALASRPGEPVSYGAVGNSLRLLGFLPAAIEYYEMALRKDPDYARAHNDLGLALQAQGRLDEAIACHQQAIQRDPDYAWAHLDLGNALSAQGRLEDALAHFELAIPIDPVNQDILRSLRTGLLRLGRGKEARRYWRAALDAGPADYEIWFGYAELCLFLGETDEYRRNREELLSKFAESTLPLVCERLGRACLLAPGSEDHYQQAASLLERALTEDRPELQWAKPYILFAKGLGEFRRGRFQQAIELVEGPAATVLAPMPALVGAMARFQAGDRDQARQMLDAAIESYDWTESAAVTADHWIAHALRREAEAMVRNTD